MDVAIEHLRFTRGGRLVLAIPSLLMRRDRTTVILGPNGAGKTTLLRLIAGLDRPDTGRILLGGREARRGEKRDVAYVFQEQVFLRQTVRDNLDLGLRLRDVPRAERAARIAAAVRLVGIEQLLDRRADHLSGGEGRRASIARALCLRSPLALFDEPLSGLDPATHARLLDELPGLLHAFGATSVLVTHDPGEALRLADDLVVLVGGRILSAGERRSVFLEPPSTEVAELLGYAVVTVGRRRVAVREESLAPGEGPEEFAAEVHEIRDLVDHEEMICSIGPKKVRVRLPRGVPSPKPGDRVLVHADRVWDVPQP